VSKRVQDPDIKPHANIPNSKAGDLAQISSLGYFLRGSSVALGLTKVTDSCEKIQSYVPEKDKPVTA
jgi:osomolarity two-component system phosphorelay intermediate protein YPD1